MANYYRVDPNFWKAERRRWTDREKLLGIYLLTCPHRNLEGLYWLPKAYIAADLGWPSRAVEEALSALVDADFAAYDDQAEVVFVLKSLEHQAPKSEKQVTGAVSSLAKVPASSLFDAFLESCETHAPQLAERIRKGLGNPSETHSDGIPDESGSEPKHAQTRSSSSSSSSSPPDPPPRGGRKRTMAHWERAVLDWAAGVGVSGEQTVLLRAIQQAKPWEQNGEAAEQFRLFVQDHFPPLEVVT
jgi:hypothetical protein